ncbi:hypothetical protein ACIRD3_18890 [Kitasatospora sp. NPDC093550]|uniref:hypothetical protein n=1 Tax=Kitasatospora sp. NPDC093550 TaxID=3364089 RepID=UPI0037F2CFAD
MPRRGEYTEIDKVPRSRTPEPARIGPRVVTALESNRQPASATVDPGWFRCSGLAAELADEWVELAAAAGHSAGTCRHYRQAIVDFCRHVDETLPTAHAASLAHEDPNLHHAVTEWIRLLPARHTTGSRIPAWLAGRVRILVGRRMQHPGRPVAPRLHGWVAGDLGIRRGQDQELDEFTRADKKKMVNAAWADCLAIAARIRAGRALAATGADPADGGWTSIPNLLWAVVNDAWSVEQISARLPRWQKMPASLRDPVLGAGFPASAGITSVCRYLIRQLFLTPPDLQPFRIALMAATGRAPDEVINLTEDDVEFGPAVS